MASAPPESTRWPLGQCNFPWPYGPSLLRSRETAERLHDSLHVRHAQRPLAVVRQETCWDLAVRFNQHYFEVDADTHKSRRLRIQALVGLVSKAIHADTTYQFS